MSILAWIVLGLIAGFIASKIVNRRGEGIVLDIIIGIVGAIVGGWITTAPWRKDASKVQRSAGWRAMSQAITRNRGRCLLRYRASQGRPARVSEYRSPLEPRPITLVLPVRPEIEDRPGARRETAFAVE